MKTLLLQRASLRHRMGMLVVLLMSLLPTKIMAETNFKPSKIFNLDGVTATVSTSTEYPDYPWTELDLSNTNYVSIPSDAKGLMSTNFNDNRTTSETIIIFESDKEFLLSFYCVFSGKWANDNMVISLDGEDTEFDDTGYHLYYRKVLESGSHTLKLKYVRKANEYDNRAFIYNLRASNDLSEFYAVYNPIDYSLTFKRCVLPETDGDNYYLVDENHKWSSVRSRAQKVVFDESFKDYYPKSCNKFFYEFTKLTTIEGLDNLNTDETTDMSYMFYDCSKLKTLDLSSFKANYVKNMAYMFFCCSDLKSITFPENLNTWQVEDMSFMFYNCQSIETLSLPLQYYTTKAVKDMQYMFSSCSNLVSLDIRRLRTENVTNMKSMFEYCTKLEDLEIYFETSNVTDMSYMFSHCEALKVLNLRDNFKTPKVTNMSYMFDNCLNLTRLAGPGRFDTSNVTDMSNMFNNCQSLELLYVTDFNTENVTNMKNMFNCCSKINSLELPNTFNTSKVKDMSSMFLKCANLKNLVIPSCFNTSNVENMSRMFQQCRNLETLDLSMFNTARVKDMSYMFYSTGIKSIDLSNFNTDSVKTMKYMFYYSDNLETVDLSNSTINGAETLYGMFYYCPNLKSVDISNFGKNNVSNMNGMFGVCTSLENVYVSDQFEVGSETDSEEMFKYCHKLPNYKNYNFDGTYAHFNKGGYLKTYYKVGDTKTELYDGNLTVDNLTLTDGSDFVAHAPFAATNATYSRTMSNTWGTLCLPFAIDTKTMNGCKLYVMDDINDDVLKIKEVDTDMVEAGQAVLVKRTGDNQQLTFTAHDAAIVKAPITSEANENKLVGTFVATEVPNDAYAIASNKFWLVSEVATNSKSVWSKGMRAYIQPAKNDGAEAKAFSLDISEDKVTTAIDILNKADEGKVEIFDINGRRLDSLQQGLNIIRMGATTKKVYVNN